MEYETYLSICFIYLFYSRDNAFIPKGYVAKEIQKSTSCSIGQLHLQMRSSALHGALCASLGGRSAPLQKRNGNRKERADLAFAPSHISRFPDHPLVHSSGTSAIFIRPIPPQFSLRQTTQGNGQTAPPTCGGPQRSSQA